MKNIGTLFGRPIGQYWEDLELWESVLNDWQGELEWIIEVGTWQGGFSFFLYSQAWARQMKFYTIDIKEPDNFVPCFWKQDIKEGFPKFWFFIQSTPGVLFCDNGNKPAEVFHLHNLLHRESLIAVHDWGTEFIPKDIPDSLRGYRSSATTIFLARNDYLNELEARE